MGDEFCVEGNDMFDLKKNRRKNARKTAKKRSLRLEICWLLGLMLFLVFLGCYLGEIRRYLKKCSFSLLRVEMEEMMEIGVWDFEDVFKVKFGGLELEELKG